MQTDSVARFPSGTRLTALSATLMLATAVLAVTGSPVRAGAAAAACASSTAPTLITGSSSTFEIDSAEKLIFVSFNQSIAAPLVGDVSGEWREQDFVQSDDIDLEGCEFTPIDSFTGSYVGQGNKIQGLRITSTGGSVGLFGFIEGGIVDGVRLVDVAVTAGGDAVGGLAGYVRGGSVTNSSTSGSVSGGTLVGGLVGSFDDGEIIDSHSAVDVSGNNQVGGLVGQVFGDTVNGRITGSTASGTVEGTGSSVGGLVGLLENGEIRGSSAHGNVTATGDHSGSGDLVGGLVGFISSGIIATSFATGEVDSAKGAAGGLVGHLGAASSITNSSAAGSVEGPSAIGGLVGSVLSDGSITNSAASGTVVGAASTGGLIGLVNVGSDLSVIASFAASGDLDGEVEAGATLTLEGSRVLDAAEFTSFATFGPPPGAGWPIVDGWAAFDPSADQVWGICPGLNAGRPFLLWRFEAAQVPVACVGTLGAGSTSTTPSGPTLACSPASIAVDGTVTCTVSGAPADFDLVWRAAYNPTFAEGVLTTGSDGTGMLDFVVPRAALGEIVTVELVAWTAPIPIGVAGGPVPASVPSGGGPAPLGMLAAALLGAALLAAALLAAAAPLTGRQARTEQRVRGLSG